MTVNTLLMIGAAWCLICVLPLASWRFAGSRRLRHVEGSKGFLRDTYLANAPVLPLLPLIVMLSALAAGDQIDGTVAWVSMIVLALFVTLGVNLPSVKRARIRLLWTRYPTETTVELEARL